MRRRWGVLLSMGALAVAAGAAVAARLVSPAPGGPRFQGEALLRPEGVERWVFAGASLGLDYAEPGAAGLEGRLFHNVYLEPRAYQHYARTGRFPEGTMLALTLHSPRERVAPARQGLFEGERMRLEIALKDTRRYPGGWAYFDFGAGTTASPARPLPREACADCHAGHAADDNVFVQFYPTLRPLSRASGRRLP